MSSTSGFNAIRTEGGLLPADLLSRVAGHDTALPGLSTSDYHLAPGERITEAIARSWNRLVPLWRRFAADLEALREGDPAAGATRDGWLYPLLDELGYGRPTSTRALEIQGKSYPISHLRGRLPMHLVGAGTSLERRQAGVRGAASASPHSMVQELLNRSNEYLWALVSNGRQLRILRDNVSLTRQAFVEFDLEAIFGNEIYDEFVVLWLVCHESRLDPESPASSWLERWREEAESTGTRALDALRNQVEQAIVILGRGFLAYGENYELRRRLRSGELDRLDYYRQQLRLIYRLIFLLVAEDRGLLFLPEANELARRRYNEFYGVSRLRDLAAGRSSRGPHPDLWRSLRVATRGLSSTEGVEVLGLPALGSFLWSDEATPDLDCSDISDTDLLAAVRCITMLVDREARLLRPIDYRNLGADELGGIYEGLLELHPVLEVDGSHFVLETFAGSERKSTGSYYTPDSLIVALLDSALTPLLDAAIRAPQPEEAILALRVLDPAVGSGHFLVAAGRRIAYRLAAVRTGDEEPSPDAVRHALRDVVGRCLFGIDLNPMALELAKISLWLEAIEPGRPLSFLDHHLVEGNALLGVTAALVVRPIPADAFKALTDDDKGVATAWRKSNSAESKLSQAGHGQFALGSPVEQLVDYLVSGSRAVEAMGDETVAQVEKKRSAFESLAHSSEMTRARLMADAWCTAFLAPKQAGIPPVTTTTVTNLAEGAVDPEVFEVVNKTGMHHRLLHWHLAFPEVFARGGFSLVVGNPPWEKVKISEKEFFAARHPEIAEMAGAKRKALIARLEVEDPTLWAEYRQALRDAEAQSLFLHTSGRFPLCGRGDINTYAVFAEAMRDALAPDGRLGVIVPTGIATDYTTREFFADCVAAGRLVSVFDFYDRKQIFKDADVHSFCLLTLVGAAGGVKEAQFVYFAHELSDLDDPERRFTLSLDDIALLNPNTKTAPVFRSRVDAELTTKIYRRVPVLKREDDPDGNPWGIQFSTMFHMTNDSSLFRTADELEDLGAQLDGNAWRKGNETWLPLYEGRLGHQFNHRFATSYGDEEIPVTESQSRDPSFVVVPAKWVAGTDFYDYVNSRQVNGSESCHLGIRRVARSTDERTIIACLLPWGPASNSWILTRGACTQDLAILCAVYNSFIFDYCTRNALIQPSLPQSTLEQLPVVPPSLLKDLTPWSVHESYGEWILQRVLELTYTAIDMEGFASDVGFTGPPFSWNPERRRLLRAELDAVIFHLYGIDRDDLAHVMDSFPVVRRREEVTFGEYRTKRMILEQYDVMSTSTGVTR